MKTKFSLKMSKKTQGKVLTFALVLFACSPMFAAAAGAGAIGSAASGIRRYVTEVEKLVYAIAAVVGIVGGIRIFNKWQNGDQDINKEIMGWGGACIFLLLAPTFIKAMFPG